MPLNTSNVEICSIICLQFVLYYKDMSLISNGVLQHLKNYLKGTLHIKQKIIIINLISTDLSGTKTISSDKKSMNILDTFNLLCKANIKNIRTLIA